MRVRGRQTGSRSGFDGCWFGTAMDRALAVLGAERPRDETGTAELVCVSIITPASLAVDGIELG